jgi:hypothetical protein
MKSRIPYALIVAAAQSAVAYELHEWGTFTTVAGSDGKLLSGLQREEEPLPVFVHSHFGMENGQMPSVTEYSRILREHGTTGFVALGQKGLGRRPVSGVTVKMETPVIYFHSEAGFKAHVKVGFTGGTISQWYPGRSGGESLPEPAVPADPKKSPTPLAKWNIDFSQPYTGGIEWEVDVLSPEESLKALTFKPKDSLTWLRARVPEANVVRNAAGETENYLFYRGIGNFDPGLHTTVSTDETLHLENKTGSDIPYLLVFDQSNGNIRWFDVTRGLPSGGKLSIAESDLTTVSGAFAEPVYQSMKTGLAAMGLLDSEAHAMVQTWWSSYFEKDGLRVFWIVPTETTNRILPLAAEPAPEKTVRVLVGRSEVLRPRKETELLAMSRLQGDQAAQWTWLKNGDRFGLAMEERIKAIEKETGSTAAK